MSRVSLADPHLRQDALLGVIEPVLAAHRLALVELSFQRERPGWVLRASIEDPATTRPGGGVTLDMCADVSRDLSRALDVADLIKFPYNLEVASPGIERPLFDAPDYSRFLGQLAKVHLGKPAPDGQRVLRGLLQKLDDGALTMLVDGRAITVPFADVSRGHIVFDPSVVPERAGGAGGSAPGRKPRPSHPDKGSHGNKVAKPEKRTTQGDSGRGNPGREDKRPDKREDKRPDKREDKREDKRDDKASAARASPAPRERKPPEKDGGEGGGGLAPPRRKG